MRFKKNYIILIIFSLCFSSVALAQSVEEIIEKHINAHGGAEKWDNIFSMAINARFTAFSEENEFYAIKSNGGQYYSDLTIGQHKVKEAFNGTSGWTIDPWHGFLYPRLLNKVEDNVFHQKAEFFTPFYKYKEKGMKVELLGEENVDGIDTYAIKLTRRSGLVETWYLDKATFLEYKSESDWVDFAMRSPAESFFDDFREVDGLVIPFYVERMFGQRDRILVIEEVAFNSLDFYDIFEMPKSAEMEKLTFLAGDWDVQVEKPSRNNSLFTVDNTVSSAQFNEVNSLTQNLSVDDYYVQSMTLNYSFHVDKNIYRLSIFNSFTSNTDIYEGNFLDGVFKADNKKDVAAEFNGPYLQLKIYDIQNDKFMMDINNSRDKGESWNLNYKLSFSKK